MNASCIWKMTCSEDVKDNLSLISNSVLWVVVRGSLQSKYFRPYSPINKLNLASLFFFLRCMYQERKVRGHVFVCWGYQFCLFLRYCYFILELFRHCGIFVFHLITDSFSCTPVIYTSTNKTDRHDITEIVCWKWR